MSKDIKETKSEEVISSDSPINDYQDASFTDEKHESQGFFKDFVHSFSEYKIDMSDIDPNATAIERANIRAARAPLRKSLKNRHLQMIAIGGSIGTGLFVGSGGALRTGGPAAVLIGWILTGIMMYCTVQALGELAVTFPVAGSFVQYNTRFISPAWGFCMAYNYAMQWIVVLPLELVAASITIRYWNDTINSAAWVVIFYVVIFIINIFGVRGYGEAEFSVVVVHMVVT
ncbi:unnamed protein product [[Candida] boidinii]|uniref:Unnamed protein product n=1 Tax=Candida boidinii TaxID=5477 RepID=A0ACB5TXK8_CANBO|nr:unnamed protein product [[Candida] boidinii]